MKKKRIAVYLALVLAFALACMAHFAPDIIVRAITGDPPPAEIGTAALTDEGDTVFIRMAVFTFGEGDEKRIGANRFEMNEAGETSLLPIENERERDLLAHCFEELKQKLRAQQAAEAEG